MESGGGGGVMKNMRRGEIEFKNFRVVLQTGDRFDRGCRSAFCFWGVALGSF